MGSNDVLAPLRGSVRRWLGSVRHCGQGGRRWLISQPVLASRARDPRELLFTGSARLRCHRALRSADQGLSFEA